MTGDTSAILIRHGLAAILIALIGGFLLTFKMIGGLSLSPLPLFLAIDPPGTVAGWKAVHLGMLMNGSLAILLGLAMRQFLLAPAAERRLAWFVLIAVWGNLCFYLFAQFGFNHGLSFGDNRLGPGNWAGALAFTPALIGALTLMIAVITLLRAPIAPRSH